MKRMFEMRDGTLVPSDAPEASIAVYAAPDDAEKRELLEVLKTDPHTLESALDPDEVSRVEFAADHTFVVWKRPKHAQVEQQYLKFEIASVGLFFEGDRLTVILGDASVPFEPKEFVNARSLADVLLRLMLSTIRHYLDHLKAVRRLTTQLQAEVSRSMENRSLLQMFSLAEGLVYYLDALESNSTVLSRLRSSVERLGWSQQQLAMLDDVVIDHQQCLKQAQIYSTVLGGLMDARGNIINNNMNILLKNLTLINVVFLPLNLLASVGGMSEFSMMTEGLNWKIAYPRFMLGMALVGWLTWVFLVRRIDRPTPKT